MNYLIDTHVFLWTLFDDAKLSAKARDALASPDHSIFLSLVSYWEISLKYAVGKLDLEGITPDSLPHYAAVIKISTLSLTEDIVSSFYKLPRTEHKDPFDRLIIWQAINEKMPLISKDSRLSDYQSFGLEILWD